MKILFLGHPTNFVNQLITAIKEVENIEASIISGTQKTETSLTYDEIIVPKTTILSLGIFIIHIPKLLQHFFKSLSLLFLDFNQGLKSFKCLYEATKTFVSIQHSNLRKYDTFNIHYLTITKAIIMTLLPKEKKKIISLWGSDLFRTSGICNNYWLTQAFKCASTIQISSIEMEQHLLGKFGFHLKPKIKHALFLPDFKLIKLIDELRLNTKAIEAFKLKYKIPQGSRCITVGNNGNEGNRHIDTLKSIESSINKEEYTIILPLTYALKPSYESELASFIKNSSLNIICFKNFLSFEELSILRIISDIFITMQITDALSGTLTETLYAGNIGIAGSWLPYGRFRESGALFLETQNFESLKKTIKQIDDSFNMYKEECEKNPELIHKYFYNKEQLINDWISIYKG